MMMMITINVYSTFQFMTYVKEQQQKFIVAFTINGNGNRGLKEQCFFL